MRDLEVSKLLKIGEFKVPDTSNSSSDCFVEEDNSTMDAGMGD